MKSTLKSIYFLCFAFYMTSCIQSEESKTSELLRLHYNDITKLVNASDLQVINKAEDQDKLSIPTSIIGRWQVSAEVPFSDQSPIELAFVNNRSNSSSEMLFRPNLLDMHSPHIESDNYIREITEFTDFCKDRVVSLDLSKAIVPLWYYSEIKHFKKLKHLRISCKTFNLASDELVIPESIVSLDIVNSPFDEQILEFVRSLRSLKNLTLISPQCANLTAPLTHKAPESYKDWIDIYSKRLAGKPYHQAITSVSLIECNELIYFALLRLEFPSLETLRADLNEVYPGSGPIFQLKQLCAAKSHKKHWPRIMHVTYLLSEVDKLWIANSLTNEKSQHVGITFKQLVTDVIKRHMEIEKKPIFDFQLNVISDLEKLNTK